MTTLDFGKLSPGDTVVITDEFGGQVIEVVESISDDEIVTIGSSNNEVSGMIKSIERLNMIPFRCADNNCICRLPKKMGE